MQDNDIMDLWKSYDRQLNETLVMNKKISEEVTKMKIKSVVASMQPIKIFTVLVGIIWVGFIDILIYNLFFTASPFFIISAIIQVLLTKTAMCIYLYQLVLIRQIDIGGPLLETQDKIARLTSTTLWVARILFLQLPLWTIFYLNISMFETLSIGLFIIQVIVTLSFTLIAIWLFRNIKYQNIEKKWFQLIFTGGEWSPLIKSMDLMNQIKEARI